MKKQNNILKYIAKITCSVILGTSLYACAEEEIIKSNYIEEGIPVEISMNFTSPEMTTLTTRGLDEDQERQVNDLYILIFNEEGKVRKAGSRLYTSNEIEDGKITLNTTSGNSLIYGIANVASNQQEQETLKNRLDLVENLSDLQNCIIKASLKKLSEETSLKDSIIDVERHSASLIMSGAYKEEGREAGVCPISSSKGLSGKIELVRLDASIQFNIQTAGVKVKKFEPKTWQVCKVPRQSYLIGRNGDNSGGTDSKNYANSKLFNNQNFQTLGKSTDGNNIYTFQFYQYENFKNPTINGKPADAKEREKEDSKTKDSRKFSYVEPCATYVEFTAYLELEVEGATRIADIKITTLLGGRDKADELFNPRNFNTWRNKKYTYTITIYDVDDIITEVEMKDEQRPAIEGDVIDAQDEVRILDAHYNTFNIALTKEQVQKMSILVHTPFDDVNYKAEENEAGITTQTPRPDGTRDYEWIKFKRTPNNDQALLANYSEKDTQDPNNERFDIFTLRDDVKERAKKEEGKGANKDIYYYTVFVDEYYYTEKPRTGLDWGSEAKEYWKYFVNQEDRYIMLIYTPYGSLDQESSYSKSRYFFRQKSIQTYYSAQNNKTALGMEHVNETLNPRWDWVSKEDLNKDNGYLNNYNYFQHCGTNWKKYVSMSNDGYSYTNATTNTLLMSTDAVHALCLSRNRDNDGDGTIDNDEMNWYVPTYKQISGMYLGATSLPSPLFNFSAPNNISDIIDINYHFMTSDHDKIWAEEGCSNGGIPKDQPNPRYANQIRCVRNLGIEGAGDKTGVPEKPYHAEKKDVYWVFDMSKMDESNLRLSKVTTKLSFHPNFTDTKNKPYKKFELATKFLIYGNLPNNRNIFDFYNENGKDRCEERYGEWENGEPVPMRGVGAWRTPNQREMLIIYNTVGPTEMVSNGKGMYSRTYWQYSTAGAYRIFAFRGTGANMFLDAPVSPKDDAKGTLRCVRDID